MKKRKTQIEVIESMLLNNQLVTASTAFKETGRQAGLSTVNLHKLIAGLRNKGYNIKDYWVTTPEGNRYKYFELASFKNVKK
jgi:hypothetical protein